MKLYPERSPDEELFFNLKSLLRKASLGEACDILGISRECAEHLIEKFEGQTLFDPTDIPF